MNSWKRKNIVVAVSGGGRSLANLIALQLQIESRYVVQGVIASNPTCGAVEIAAANRIPLFIGNFGNNSIHDTTLALNNWLMSLDPKLIVLAGFLKTFPILKLWEKNIINIHPALLPRHGGKGMYGERVHRAVIDAADKVSGATVHFVNDKYDDGQIISQMSVPVFPGETAPDLAKRVFEAECLLLPHTINRILDPNYLTPGEILWRINE